MRYARNHKLQTSRRIVEQASYGLREKGIVGLSVGELRKLSGLTLGGFSNHFESRAALVNEAIAFAMEQTNERWNQLKRGRVARERLDALIAEYLSPRQRDNRKHGCALPALAADVGRLNRTARQNFASKLDQMIDIVAEMLSERSPSRARHIATGIIATMVGSVVLSRAVYGTEDAENILKAGRTSVDQLRMLADSNRARHKISN